MESSVLFIMAHSQPLAEPSGSGADDHIDDENTPLLTAAVSTSAPSGDSTPTTTAVASGSEDGDDGDDDKPLPSFQIMILCYARWIEPIAFFSIFPYMNKMTQENGNLAKADVGFYSGMIESLFSLTQMVLMIFWGKAADRFGRKPVLVASLLGMSLATGLFGMAKTIWQMILFRCLAGVFAGTLVTIRTMLSEHSTPKTQARAFSHFAFAGNIGILFGQLLGGLLAEPADRYPKLFGGVRFFVNYPYALPNLTVSAIGFSAVLITALFAEETLVRESPESDEDGTSFRKPPPLSTWELIKSPGVPVVLYTYAHVMMLAFAYTAIAPLFWFTPIELGGLSFSPFQIALFMGLAGLAQAVWILVVFPPLQRRIGTNGVMRVCGNFYPIFFAVCPLFNLLLRSGHSNLFWGLAPPLVCLGSGVSLSFTAIQLAINEVSPSPAVLGTLNAVGLSLVTGVRAASPAAFSSLFAVGARTQWMWGYAIWVLMCVLGAAYAVVSRYLPDYQELKKRREVDRVRERLRTTTSG